MFKRLFWLVVGARLRLRHVVLADAASSRETVDRYSPERCRPTSADAIRGLGHDLRAAVAEGREAMRERETSCAPSSPRRLTSPNRLRPVTTHR